MGMLEEKLRSIVKKAQYLQTVKDIIDQVRKDGAADWLRSNIDGTGNCSYRKEFHVLIDGSLFLMKVNLYNYCGVIFLEWTGDKGEVHAKYDDKELPWIREVIIAISGEVF